MAKKKQTILINNGKIEEPFASAPTRLPRYGFYITRGDTVKLVDGYENFYALYAAKRFLDTLINGRETLWIKEDTLYIIDPENAPANDITVRGANTKDIEDAMEYEPTPDETEWVVPEPYASRWQMWAGIIKQVPDLPDLPSAPKSNRSEGSTAKARTKAPKVSREGLTSLADVCASLNVEPRDARAILRKASFPKPDAGWAWPNDHADIEKVTALIKGGKK